MISVKLEVYGLKLPLIEGPTDLPKALIDAAKEVCGGIKDSDVLVVTSKLVLKAKGLMIKLGSIKPGLRAKLIHKLIGKDPIETELVLRNSVSTYAVIPTKYMKKYVGKLSRDPRKGELAIESIKALMIVKLRNGLIASDAGLDYSNLPPGHAITSNHDFDELAKEIRLRIKELTGKEVAVVITDTEVALSNGKFGSLDLAVGSSGIDPIARELGEEDLYGRPKFGGLDIIVDEVAAAAALLMKQSHEGVPAVLIRGLKYRRSELGVKDILITRRSGARSRLLKIALLNLVLKLLRII